MSMAVTVVYLSHGGARYHDQARLSILTLLHAIHTAGRSDIKIVVYTDDASAAPRHALIATRRLSAQDLVADRGAWGNIHRVKTRVLARASREFDSALFFIDSDTRWRALPTQAFAAIEAGAICLHVDEGALGPQRFPDIMSDLRKHHAQIEALGVSVRRQPHMWNAGVIGAPAGAGAFFDKIIGVTDFLYVRIRNRLWSEQMATSLVAASDYAVVTCEDAIHHYWAVASASQPYISAIFAAMDPAWPIERQAAFCAAAAWDDSELMRRLESPAARRSRRLKKLRASMAKRSLDLRLAFERMKPLLGLAPR